MRTHMSRATLLVALAHLPAGCRTPGPDATGSARLRDAETVSVMPAGAGLDALPRLGDEAALEPIVRTALTAPGLSLDDKRRASGALAHYLAFIGVEPGSTQQKNVLKRLLDSSTQFLLCKDFSDWECLERKPLVRPKKAMRQDTTDDLGRPVVSPDPLRLEAWVTEQWDRERDAVDWSAVLARRLADKLGNLGKDGVAMAAYGIDAIDDSMKPVYDAIVARADAGVDVRAVVDTEGFHKNAVTPVYFSLKKPASGSWMFDDAQGIPANKTMVQFQYNNTRELLARLNRDVASEEEAKGRIEWPTRGIMHNKFVVLKDDGKLSVWTGTANISDTCMGAERNSNIGIFIQNDEIARTFLDEFEEMYAWKDKKYVDKQGRVLDAQGGNGIKVGHFHADKRPNTKRYFKFADGVEARVHFAPTDDAEHRVLLPMLLSAQKGDEIRIAMFGGAGLELVRAMQYAAAQGAEIRIVLDRTTGAGKTSWVKDAAGNVLEKNPYRADAPRIVARMSTWKGLNHHKTATLTRRLPSGEKRIEELVIGSQNWSVAGNDQNDENMITLRRLSGDVPGGELFNRHFDTRLWPAAAAGELTAPPTGDGGGGDEEEDVEDAAQ